MLDKIRAAIAKFELLNDCNEVLVGLSGGADSVALLCGLNEIKRELNINLKAIHINHNIRGEEALRDQEFCINLCFKLNIPLVIESVDIPRLSKEKGESEELCARNERYRLFRAHSKGLIATAHNAEDNAETILFNLTRGTGSKGICGIPPKRDNIIRPLILCNREDIIFYLKSLSQAFVIDSTNLSDDYSRNKIRHNVIPSLKELNPSFFDSVLRFSEIAREDSEYLDKIAAFEFNRLLINEDNELILDKKVALLDSSIRKRVLSLFSQKCGISTSNMDYNKLSEMNRVLLGEIKSFRIQGECDFKKIKKGFIILKKQNCDNFSQAFSFDKSDFIKINAVDYKNSLKINNLLFKFSIDCDKIKGELQIRSRAEGDRYRLASRNITKTIKKLLNESELTPKQKADLFILCDDEGIIFTNLFGIDERVRVDDNSKNIVVYKAMEGKTNA